jgi:hypothetical protein
MSPLDDKLAPVGLLRAEPIKRKGTQMSFQKKPKPFGFLIYSRLCSNISMVPLVGLI